MAPLLEIKGLKTHFSTDDGMVQAVDGIDITLNKGETLCVVGESGCGKTVTAMSILKLIAMPPGRIVAGQILFEGRDLVPLTSNELDNIRAKEIGFIFQEPMTSLNPVLTVGEQVAEVLRRHEGLSNKEIGARLYLSHRTVGYHLHRIFSKAGITSRSGLRPVLASISRPAD